jgi:exodeoxyribonuclease V alpha subunit
MLQRNLLYTAVTRARRLVCLVGTRAALRRAIANADRARRFTALGYFLTNPSDRP